jgi:hypothetical protein
MSSRCSSPRRAYPPCGRGGQREIDYLTGDREKSEYWMSGKQCRLHSRRPRSNPSPLHSLLQWRPQIHTPHAILVDGIDCLWGCFLLDGLKMRTEIHASTNRGLPLASSPLEGSFDPFDRSLIGSMFAGFQARQCFLTNASQLGQPGLS